MPVHAPQRDWRSGLPAQVDAVQGGAARREMLGDTLDDAWRVGAALVARAT